MSRTHAEPRLSKMALTAFLLSFIPCVGVIGVILGIISTISISTKDALKGLGLSISSIAIGLVMVPICFVLFGILVPALAIVRVKANQAKDAHNLKQIYTMVLDHHTQNPQLSMTPNISEIISSDEPFLDSPLAEPINFEAAPTSKTGDYRYGDYVFCYGKQNIVTLGPNDMIAFSAEGKQGRNILFADGRATWHTIFSFEQKIQDLNTKRLKAELPPIDPTDYE